MTSLRQIEANRRSALKSTGPATPEGKQRSRCNAVRHGLTAETVIAVLEDSEDYEAFEAAVISDYDAETATERELVLRLASVLWRLRRATRATGWKQPFLIGNRDARSLFRKPDAPSNDPKKNCRCFLRLRPTSLDRLSRYEHSVAASATGVFTLEPWRRRKREPPLSFPFPFQRREPGALSEESR
jgi:hypothetical protein